jgi:hypothetical protein
MVRRLLLAAAFLALLAPLLGCPTDPQDIRSTVVQKLQPYFPRVQAYVDPKQGTIMGLTCTHDEIGPALVQKMQEQIAGDRDVMGNLALLRMVAGYRVFAVGFQRQIVRYDIGSGYVLTQPAPAGYAQAYEHYCGAAQDQSVPVMARTFVWLGRFRIQLPDKPAFVAQDVLGLYGSEGEFRAHQEMEIAARKQIIRGEYPNAAIELLNVMAYPIR